MTQVVKLKRGLDINLKGKPRTTILSTVLSDCYTLFPDDFPGFTPKVAVKAGDSVLAGTPVLYDKNRPEMKIVSPVSGEVKEVNRGDKRKLLSLVILASKENKFVDFGKKKVDSLDAEAIKQYLSAAGMMAFIRQRPYDVVADPRDTPRDIFVSGFYSAPLSPNLEFVLRGQESDFQTGLDALSRLTVGNVYLGIRSDCSSSCLKEAGNVVVVPFEGPHPAGNAGVQINHIRPVNKGDVVWTIDPADVLLIGRLLNGGIADFRRLIALTGSEVKETGYHSLIMGACIRDMVLHNTTEGIDLRFISGNVLTGTRIQSDGYLHAYDNQVTVIPEGSETHEFFGWASPGLNKFSNSKTFLSRVTGLLTRKEKEYVIDARIKGGKRAMIMSHEYDNVFPMSILPEFLLKAIIAFDIDKMENLGIYEVAPEDFALCEFVDTSKIEIQQIVRKGLDLLYKEMN